jgi:hypothetical protein
MGWELVNVVCAHRLLAKREEVLNAGSLQLQTMHTSCTKLCIDICAHSIKNLNCTTNLVEWQSRNENRM